MNITVEPGSHPLSSSLTSSHPLSSPHPLSSSPLPPLHLEDYMYKVPPGIYSFVYLYVYLVVCLYVQLSIYVSVCLSIYLSK